MMKNNYAYVSSMKKIFTPGLRIKLESMRDPYAVPDGTLGTVDFVDDAGQIHMKWDNGSSLALIYGEDVFQIIPDNCGTKFVIKGLFNGQLVYFNRIENQHLWGTEMDVRYCDKSIKGATLFDSMEEAEEMCHIINNKNFKIYPVCPRCHNEYDGYPAISRFDNKTEICSACGTIEALHQFINNNKKTSC